MTLILLFLSISCFAQDKVYLRNNTCIDVKIVKSNDKTIEYTYPDESLINEKSKKEISYIIYANGRKEECNKTFEIPIIESNKDWEKVVITYLPSDVEGLTRVDEIKATSGWGGALGSSLGYKDALNKLKKRAAKLKAGVVLVVDRPNSSATAIGGGVQVAGVAYK